MEPSSIHPHFDDPWQGRMGRLLTIVLLALVVLLPVGVVDGIYLFGRMNKDCALNPREPVCKYFATAPTSSARPKLDIVVDYGRGTYAIQLGAFNNEAKARSAGAQLQSFDIAIRILKSSKGRNRSTYVAQFGRFTDRKVALQAAQALKARGLIADFAIGEFALPR